MFKAVAKDARLLRDSVDIISQLIDDGLFNITKSGIELETADRTMVSFIDFKMKASSFENYECDKDASIGINLLNLLTVLKRANLNDKLTLFLNEKDSALEITLEGSSVRRFSIPLLQISKSETPDIEQLLKKFSADAEVSSAIIEQGINDADIIADSVIIELSPDKLRMFAEGNSSKSELKIFKGTDTLTKLNAKETVNARYSLDYLKKMIKGSKLFDKVNIMLGKDFPLRMVFENDDIFLGMILAPRVSESE
ncbi:proliferating cell nuclear antigen (pcna) [Candidatus Micrarchaeota archaeon RBG_16_36_9]|nr:MAG: proliferating cell nuclear antigen (pcna) [Candidatus Micrarchaeota archaeon RBG_16_36_9]